MAGKTLVDYGEEMSILLQQMTSNVEQIRGNHLWFYFKSMIPKAGEPKDIQESTNLEIISHIEKGIEKISQKMNEIMKALENGNEIAKVRKQISSVQAMIPELKHWLQTACSKSDRELERQAQGLLPFLEDLSGQLLKLSETETKSKDGHKQSHKVTPKVSKLQSNLECEKLMVQKLRNTLSSVGLSIDEAMDANKILDSMATSPRFLKAVRDRLATREQASNFSKKKLTLDDLLTWTDMPRAKCEETKWSSSELDSTLQPPLEDGFLQVLNDQLNAKYDVLAQRQKALNHKLRMAQEEERLLRFQLEKTDSNILELKEKLANLATDWKMLDDFRSLAESYKKQK